MRRASRCLENADVKFLPRWRSDSCPSLFAPVGIGLDGNGGYTVRPQFAEMPIYFSQANNPSICRVRDNLGIGSAWKRRD